MKIAFTAKGAGWDSEIDPRFGRSDFLLVYDEENDNLISYDNRTIRSVAHGAGPKTAQKLFELSPKVLITGNGPGGNALAALNSSNVAIFTGANGMSIRDAYQAYKDNKLQQQR